MSSQGEVAVQEGANLYDELPYDSTPIEWSAPERLALCALLHGGPRVSLTEYCALELGCGDGANLIPLAFHRPHARFVGVDGSRDAIAQAESKRRALGLRNLRFIHSDFARLSGTLEGPFQFILAHGVFSWVAKPVRDELLAFCAKELDRAGLLYLNYNTRPGWDVRGLVRDFLCAQTAHIPRLQERTQAAQRIAAVAAAAHAEDEHPYMQLMAREYRFVCEGQPSYVAHEFLAPENHAYWRGEFALLLAEHGLRVIAEADGTHAAGRVPDDLHERLRAVGWGGMPVEDCADLFTYRQLHSPVIGRAETSARAATTEELCALWLASPLAAQPRGEVVARFRHPDGREVEVRDESLASGLAALAEHWPVARPLRALFADPVPHLDDLTLLHRHGLIELRLIEPSSDAQREADLASCERAWKGYTTNRYHKPVRCEVVGPSEGEPHLKRRFDAGPTEDQASADRQGTHDRG